MAYNLKKFTTQAAYEAAIGSLDCPNVSWVTSSDTLHYLLEEPQAKFIAKNGNTVLKTAYCNGSPLTTADTQTGYDTSAATDVIISDCVNTLPDWTFYTNDGRYFDSLSSVTVPYTVTQIPSEFVRGCTALTSFDIPSGCTRIAWEAFRESGIEQITIPSSMLEIESPAFADCTGLTGVTVLATTPPALTWDYGDTFQCPIYVPAASVDAYKAAQGWSNYTSLIEAIPEPPKVTATIDVSNTSKPTVILGSSAAISGISKMYIDGVEQPSVVSEYTFSTTGDHTVECELADSTKIPYRMFYSRTPIKNITISSSVTLIEDEALYNSPSTSLTVEATAPPTLGTNALYYAKFPPTIYVPSASVSTYQAASGWSTYSANIQAIP